MYAISRTQGTTANLREGKRLNQDEKYKKIKTTGYYLPSISHKCLRRILETFSYVSAGCEYRRVVAAVDHWLAKIHHCVHHAVSSKLCELIP
jgi:hypothetical protein